eukprot:TRINITY_DN130_c1_g2_i1.p1 TRINITY_DN130_c1_g2~~TRINITY_DN130_c1_g2_i1.p1  ORF type:complete len:185 (-),score=43.89 TRINITY_DN130_c1_g2_i1:908-1462(-)
MLFKVIVVGDEKVGKTALLNRYCRNEFLKDIPPTKGVEFSLKTFECPNDTVSAAHMQFWDIASTERFGNKTGLYMQDAAGMLVVYDSTRMETLETALAWKVNADRKLGRPIPAVLITTKRDLRTNSALTPEQRAMHLRLANDYNFLAFFDVSAFAKKDPCIDAAFKMLLGRMMEERMRGDEGEA